MATEGSARTLGMCDQIGAVVPGRKADIVFLDLTHPNLIPLNDPVNQLVHTENGGAVDSVMIGGRMVLHRGRFTTVDPADVRRKVANRVAALTKMNSGDQDSAARGGSYRREVLRRPGPPTLSSPSRYMRMKLLPTTHSGRGELALTCKLTAGRIARAANGAANAQRTSLHPLNCRDRSRYTWGPAIARPDR